MRNRGWVLLLLVSFMVLAFFQHPLCLGAAGNKEWEKTYGGTGEDFGRSVELTSDGGYIIVGSTSSFGAGDSDIYLVKVDGSGNKEWEEIYGGKDNELGTSVQVTSDGGYILLGVTSSFGADDSTYDIYLVKVDDSGNKMWEKTYPYSGKGYDEASSVLVTSDGGYIVAGTKSYDAYLVKVDGSGSKVWEKTYGGEDDIYGYDVQLTGDGGYVLTGNIRSASSTGVDVYLVKVDGSGNKTWEKTYEGNGGDSGFSVQVTSDGGYIVAGITASNADHGDVYLVKVDSSGNKLWEKTYGGTGEDFGRSVELTSDGGYIVAAYSTSFSEGYDVYLVKVDSAGNKKWEKVFGEDGDDRCFSVQVTSDGGYIVAGYTSSFGAGGRDVYLLKAFPPPVFDVSDLTVNPLKVAVNQPTTISVKVRNIGELSADYTVELKVNGATEAKKTVFLTVGSQTIVSFEVSRGTVGINKVDIGSLSGSFNVKLMKPAAFELSGLTINPAQVEVNQPVTASVTVKNIGESRGDYAASFTVNGVVEDTKIVTLAVDAQSSVTFTTTKAAAGTYTVSIGDLSGGFIVKQPPKPAAISVKTLQLSKTLVKLGEEVEATVTLENAGEVSGSYTVKISLDGVEKNSSTVTVDGGKTATKTVKLSSSVEGVHKVTADGKSIDFEVKKESSGIDGFHFEGVFIGLMLAVLLLTVFKRS